MVECFSVRQTVSRIYLFRFKGRNQNTNKSGDNSREDTPVPISNTEVKLLSADDTWREAAWESRTLPVFFFFCFLQTGSVSTFRKYAFPDGIGFAARMKSVKLGALVIWTLPVVYYKKSTISVLFFTLYM